MSWLAEFFLALFQASARRRAEELAKVEAEKEASRRAIREELEAAERRRRESAN